MQETMTPEYIATLDVHGVNNLVTGLAFVTGQHPTALAYRIEATVAALMIEALETVLAQATREQILWAHGVATATILSDYYNETMGETS